jgi:hypothetical protein
MLYTRAQKSVVMSSDTLQMLAKCDDRATRLAVWGHRRLQANLEAATNTCWTIVTVGTIGRGPGE